MLRSLFSGVSGLRSHQVRMDVIGNNIANVNTTGFKSSRTNFQDLLSQTLRSASGATANTGSVNPSQVGLGVTVAGINTNMSQGALQTTGRTLDLAIQGNGFFIIKKNLSDTDAFYTREGIFYISYDGSNYYLVNSNGYYVCKKDGTAITLGSADIETINISDTGVITVNGDSTTTYGPIALASFPNPEGLEKAGQNLFRETPASGAHTYNDPGEANSRVVHSRINSGYLEMSNVDLSDEFTNMIVTQRGFQANARVITVSDTLLQELVDLKR